MIRALKMKWAWIAWLVGFMFLIFNIFAIDIIAVYCFGISIGIALPHMADLFRRNKRK